MREDQKQANGVSIHAGFPNPAADKSLGNLDLHQLLVQRPASTFLFRITGSEWQDIGIFDNDIAIIDRALAPRTSDIVAWWSGGEGEFQLSQLSDAPLEAEVFGVVTAAVHQFKRAT